MVGRLSPLKASRTLVLRPSAPTTTGTLPENWIASSCGPRGGCQALTTVSVWASSPSSTLRMIVRYSGPSPLEALRPVLESAM